MTTYATLKSDIADYIVRSDLTSVIPTFVDLCESRIRRDVRVRDMETVSTLSVTAQTEALPTGFLKERRLVVSGSPNGPIKYLAPDRFWESSAATESGTPVAYTIEDGNFVFAPAPSSVSILVNYIKAYDALSDDADTNWLLTNHYDIYLYGSVAEAANYIDDNERALKYDQLYQRAVDQVNKSDHRGRFGGILQRVPRVCP